MSIHALKSKSNKIPVGKKIIRKSIKHKKLRILKLFFLVNLISIYVLYVT